MPVCTCSTPYGLVTHIVSSPDECRRLENLLRNRGLEPVECRYYEGGFIEPF